VRVLVGCAVVEPVALGETGVDCEVLGISVDTPLGDGLVILSSAGELLPSLMAGIGPSSPAASSNSESLAVRTSKAPDNCKTAGTSLQSLANPYTANTIEVNATPIQNALQLAMMHRLHRPNPVGMTNLLP
jgi:hypothetical protein